MQLHAAQERFIADRARYTLAVAGHQGGKTLAAAKAFGERLRETYNERIRAGRRSRPIVNAWVVTPTYELATMPQRYLRGVFGPQARWRGRMRGIYLECEPWPGCIVKFRSGEHPEKLVSEPVDAMWANETARIKADAWRGNMRMRLTATHGWMLADTTPLGQNWVYEDLYLPSLPPGHPLHVPERYSPEYSSHLWHTADNPAVDPASVEEARRTLPAAYFAREFLADFSAFHGQVFPHWSAENIAPVRLEDYPAVELAADWGFAPGHPFVLLVVGVDLHGRRVGVAEEHVHEGMLFERQIELIARVAENHPRVRRLTGDSADPGMLAMARARRIGRHVDVVGASKEAGSVHAGTMVQADLIGEAGRYVVDPSCKVTIRQHVNARWKDKPGQQGSVTEEVLRVDDDTVAAMRYLVYPRIGHARTRKAG